LLGLLAGRGYTIVSDPAQAQIVIVNTCGFIEPAKEEAIDTLFEMAEYKLGGSLELLIATGCLTQRYGEALHEGMPEVDAFLGVSEYERIFEAIDAAYEGKRPLFTGEGKRFLESPRILTTPGYTAYVKISDGCDNQCSYCAIPMIRGAYRSRPFDAILAECRALSEGGAGELTLIAQDTSRYGTDFTPGKSQLPELMRAIDSLDSVRWLRVLYCYPDTVDERLLDALAHLDNVCPYLDLPLQHISPRILRAMNRRGSPDYIRTLIARCRELGITLRTTMIVGFPGETDAEFEELMAFVREERFDRLGAFTYSPEEGTPAAELPDQIAEEVKQERLDRLMTLQQGISAELMQGRIGEICEVLTEGKADGRYYGRSRLEAPEIDGKILFAAHGSVEPGTYRNVRITGALAYDLLGEEV